MARSVVGENVSVDGDWYNSSSEPGWKWKGDTSSDEVGESSRSYRAQGWYSCSLSCVALLQVVGHMFAYPLVFDLVADDVGTKEEVSSLVDDVVGTFVSYFMLIFSEYRQSDTPLLPEGHSQTQAIVASCKIIATSSPSSPHPPPHRLHQGQWLLPDRCHQPLHTVGGVGTRTA